LNSLIKKVDNDIVGWTMPPPFSPSYSGGGGLFVRLPGLQEFVVKEFAWLGHALYNCCIVTSAKKRK
jgi:hypothetical protein